MIRTLAWKDYREHRSIWLALAVLAALVLPGLMVLLDPPGQVGHDSDKLLALVFAAVTLASTYALVCGAMLLAGEREEGTLPFLDSLGRRRAAVWRTKLLTGMCLTVGQVVVVALLFLVAIHTSPDASVLAVTALVALMPVALEALAWGLLFSCLCRTVLAAAGLAAAALVAVWLLTFALVPVLGPFIPAARCGLALVVLQMSLRLFSLEAAPTPAVQPRRRVRPPVLFWLTWRQGRRAALGIWLICALFAALPGLGMPAWPVATALVGILCGVGVFAGEQASGAYRFLGNQRLPLGRIWRVRQLVWLLIGASGAGLLLVAASGMMAVQGWQEYARYAGWYGRPGDIWTLMRAGDGELACRLGWPVFGPLWLVYGFAAGQFCALAFRKSAAAVVVAVPLTAAFLGAWLPSLVCGGVEPWQLLGVPVLLLATTRLAMRPWVSDQLHGGRAFFRLGVWVAVAAAWLAGNLAYRVAAIPAVGAPFDVRAYEQRLPAPGQNEAGRLARRALAGFAEHMRAVTDKLGSPDKPLTWEDRMAGGMGLEGGMAAGPPLPEMLPSAPRPAPGEGADAPEAAAEPAELSEIPGSYTTALELVLQRGWPKKAPQFQTWLDRVCRGEWMADVARLTTLPPGMLRDPRDATFFSPDEALGTAGEMGQVLTARALQRHAQGRTDEALQRLAEVLALSRTLRCHAPTNAYLAGLTLQGQALQALDVCWESIARQPPLLRQALDLLTRHETETPPLSDAVKADYVALLRLFEEPPSWLLGGNSPAGAHAQHAAPALQWLAAARQVPWEKERGRRLLDLVFLSRLHTATSLRGVGDTRPAQLPPPGWQLALGPGPAPGNEQVLRYLHEVGLPAGDTVSGWWDLHTQTARGLYQVRALRLRLASALFQRERRKAPQTVEDLVPRYLAEPPLDPTTGIPLPLQGEGDDASAAAGGGS